MTDKQLKKLAKYLSDSLSQFEITDVELKKIGEYVAESLITKALEKWKSQKNHMCFTKK